MFYRTKWCYCKVLIHECNKRSVTCWMYVHRTSAQKGFHLEQVQSGEGARPRSPTAEGSNRTWWDLVPSLEPLHSATCQLSWQIFTPEFWGGIKIQNSSEVNSESNIQRTHQCHQGISFNCLFTQTDCLFIFGAKLGGMSFHRALITPLPHQ